MSDTQITVRSVAYSLDGAAEAVGISKSEIQRAIREGDLIAHHVGIKPIIRAVELDEWVASLPTEPHKRAPRQPRTV